MTARPPLRRPSRDTLLRWGGAAGMVYETVIEHAEKPTLIVAFMTMLGLPAFLKDDERRMDPPAPTPVPVSPPGDP